MDKIELKKSFHTLIDEIENESILANFYELMKNANSTQNGTLWNRLSSEEQEELMLALKESENPDNLISHSEMKKKHQKWL
jgi:hypothetical protein